MPLLTPEEQRLIDPNTKRELRAQRRTKRRVMLSESIAKKKEPWDRLRIDHAKRVQTSPNDWDEFKAAQRAECNQSRGVVVPPFPNLPRGARLHDCVHTPKHHKQSGRCRKGCSCTHAADREAHAL